MGMHVNNKDIGRHMIPQEHVWINLTGNHTIFNILVNVHGSLKAIKIFPLIQNPKLWGVRGRGGGWGAFILKTK